MLAVHLSSSIPTNGNDGKHDAHGADDGEGD
jgi:hypothetical protein